MKLTKTERRVKEILEKNELHVWKGSYPDFIIWNATTGSFCLLEVKGTFNSHRSADQMKTDYLLQCLGVHTQMVTADEEESRIFERVRNAMETPELMDKTRKLDQLTGQMTSIFAEIRNYLVRNKCPEALRKLMETLGNGV